MCVCVFMVCVWGGGQCGSVSVCACACMRVCVVFCVWAGERGGVSELRGPAGPILGTTATAAATVLLCLPVSALPR